MVYPGRNNSEDKRIFNYRLSQARRIVENAFGILAVRWRIYHRRINICPEKINKIIHATCVLHNYLQDTSVAGNVLMMLQGQDEQDNEGLLSMTGTGNNPGGHAIQIRDHLKTYFNSDAGAIPWQHTVVQRGRTVYLSGIKFIINKYV